MVVLTNWVDRAWTEGNNELILALPSEFPNVNVGYWADMAPKCEGNCYAPPTASTSAPTVPTTTRR